MSHFNPHTIILFYIKLVETKERCILPELGASDVLGSSPGVAGLLAGVAGLLAGVTGLLAGVAGGLVSSLLCGFFPISSSSSDSKPAKGSSSSKSARKQGIIWLLLQITIYY